MNLGKLIVLGLVGFAAQLVDGALGMGYGVTSSSLLIAVAVFGGMYVYATIKGGALDKRNAALAAQAETNGD